MKTSSVDAHDDVGGGKEDGVSFEGFYVFVFRIRHFGGGEVLRGGMWLAKIISLQ